MKKIAARLGLVMVNIIVFLIEEAWIIAAVAILPFWLAIIVVTLLLSVFSMTSTYLCGQSELPETFSKWIEKKKANANERLSKVVNGTVWTASLTTAIVVSPTTSAVMLHLAGIKKDKAYISDVIFSFVSGSIWCLIYGGGLVVLRKLFERI